MRTSIHRASGRHRLRSSRLRVVAALAALVVVAGVIWVNRGDSGSSANGVPGTQQEDPQVADHDDSGDEVTVPDSPATVPPGPGPANQIVPVDPNAGGNTLQARQAAYDNAVVTRAALEVQVTALTARIGRLDAASRQHVQDLSAAQANMQKRVVAAYLRGGESVDIDDTNAVVDQVAAVSVMGALMDDDQTAIVTYTDAKAKADAGEVAAATELTTAQASLEQAKANEASAKLSLSTVQQQAKVSAAGGSFFIQGFFFPVDSPHNFVSSFGAARSGGGFHRHQGNDIMSPRGTKEFACERGVITKIDHNSLGGNSLWIKGESGTSYYYAHLDHYANITEGQVVNAGDLVGYVGNTGDAAGGATHLHFEIHPNGGGAVNPYPILVAADPGSSKF